jgi:arylsulfatase A
VSLLPSSQRVAASGRTAPNIVIVICDDIGYGDLGCYGGKVIETPNLDALARSGARVTSMYSGGPTCSPSRAALLTGRVAPRTGVGRVLFPNEDRGLHQGTETIASYLASNGYVTGCFGKWHLGDMPGRGPMRFGFDTYFGLPFSNDTPPYELYRDEEVVENPPKMSGLSQRYTAAAVDFIESTPEDQPFFTYVAFTMPHYPVSPEPDFDGVSAGGPYGDVVEAIDHYCGVLHESLEKAGRSDNTIFIFTSDHGPWFEGSTGGVRGRKFETWEGGMRVPFLISWPAEIEPERVIESPMATVDVLPTLCNLLGLSGSSEKGFDGEDIMPTLLAEESVPHGPIWYFDGYILNAVRQGKWKLHRRRQTWGAERFAQMSLPQLFNLEIDPGESYDLSSRHPEVVAELMALMETFEAGLDVSADDRREWWKAGDVVLADG